jgi:hypothetical protein
MGRSIIGNNIEKFRSTGNIWYIFKAMIQAFQQGRIIEVIQGIYLNAIYSPSSLKPIDNNTLQKLISEFKILWDQGNLLLSREKLIAIYGNNFLVGSLPEDFSGARSQTIAQIEEFLIIGEYGKGNRVSRIAILTSNSCTMNNYYTNYSSIVHIHAIYHCNYSNELFVTTGDSSKFLDKWTFIRGELFFVKRIRKRLGGYTAIAEIKNEYYFGTDFSERPNYIETLDRKKFFYPSLSYKEWVLTFFILSNRYLLSVHRPLLNSDKTISIFDTRNKEFIFCDKLENVL